MYKAGCFYEELELEKVMKNNHEDVYILGNLYTQLYGDVFRRTGVLHGKRSMFRKAIKDFCILNNGKLTADSLKRLGQEQDEERIIDFLQDCYLEQRRILQHKNEQNQKVYADFPDDVVDLLESIHGILEFTGDLVAVDINGDLRIPYHISNGALEELVLEKAHRNGQEDFYIEEWSYFKEDEGYVLELKAQGEVVTVQFQTATRYQVFFDYSRIGFQFVGNQNIWYLVGSSLLEMYRLAQRYGEDRLSHEEKELLPMAHLVTLMGVHNELDLEDMTDAGMDAFQKYVRARGLGLLEQQMEELRRIVHLFQTKATKLHRWNLERKAFRIQKILSMKECESLWRDIYGAIRNATSRYAQMEGLSARKETVLRERITQELVSQGFQGEYPDFRKIGSWKGIDGLRKTRLGDRVVRGKIMASYVTCYGDSLYLEGESIILIEGRIFLEDQNAYQKMDVYSAFFKDGRMRRGTTTRVTALDSNGKLIIEKNRIGYVVASMLLLGSCFFGLFMMIGFMLLSFLIDLLLSQSFMEAGRLFLKTPWYLVFLGCGGAFGFIIGVIQIISKRR